MTSTTICTKAMSNSKEMRFNMVLAAVDKVSQVVDRISSKAIQKFDEIQKKSDKVARQSFAFARQTAQIGVATGGLLAATVLPAAGLEARLSNVGTLIDTNVESLAEMREEVLAIATNAPAKLDDLAAGLYDIRSAGVAADDAMDVLEASMKLSTAGLSTASEATNILTSAYNAFKEEGLDVAEINDIIFKTVKAGKTNVSELAQAFGSTAPIVQSAGVKLADFQASTAALTTLGTPAAQAQNQIRASVVALLKPTADMEKVFKALGVKDGPELIKMSGGLGAVFKNVAKGAEAVDVNITKAWGRTEALAAATSIAGATNKAYLDTLDSMVNGSNAVEEAFIKQSETFNAQKQIFINNAQAMAISVGSILLPVLVDLMKGLKPIVQGVRGWVQENPVLTKTLVAATGALTVLTLGLSAVGFIFGGVMQAISIGTTVFKAVSVAMKSATATTRIFNLTLLMNPFVLVAVAAIAAIALIVYHWDAIKAFFVDLWDKIKAAADAAWDWIKGVFNKFLSWFDAWGKYIIVPLMPFIGIPLLIIRNWGKIKGFFADLWSGIVKKAEALYSGLKKIFQKVRNLLPFSPAKEGPFQDIHKVKIVETIANAQTPDPLVKKMRNVAAASVVAVTPLVSSAAPVANPYSQTQGPGSGVVINYNPSVTVSGSEDPDAVRAAVLSALRENETELIDMIERANARKGRRAF